MAAFLHDHGVPANELSFFREQRASGQRWIGLDYYPTCEHRIASTGRSTTAPVCRGLLALAMEYWHRYRVPLFHCETNRVANRATGWLETQWRDVEMLRAAGVPVRGFTWYSLTDQIDWQYALRVQRNEVHAVGLFDLKRRIRPVGRAYHHLIARTMGAADIAVPA
jgi:beta-glucosidase/6-phospho-beta-glucosidase/beta-galactosidase